MRSDSSHFGRQVLVRSLSQAKTNIVRANRIRLLVRDRIRRWCSGHLFARVIHQLGRCTQQIQANMDNRFVWRRGETRRVHFARPRTQASEPTLIDSSLAAKRRAEALHVVFFSTKKDSGPNTMTCCCCCCCCCCCVAHVRT